jgi:hypothetical protein
MAIKDWSETAASNTTIDGINIAEFAPFANMNDMGRAIMAGVREEVASQGSVVTAGAIATISGASQFKQLTGSTTITAMDTAVTGLYREMLAASALNIGNTTALGLDQFSAGLSIPTDSLVKARSLGAGNWSTHIERGDGLPLVRFWEQEQAAVVTAATVVDLSATIPFGTLTGNTTVEGYATAITGAYRELRVLGTPLLKHNGASNIVPGSANLTLAAGDVLRSRSLGAGNWSHKVDKADGTAVAVAAAPSAGLVYNYIGGLTLSNNVATPNSKIDVAAGVAADSTNVEMISYAGGTLDLTTTGANGLRTGVLGNNTNYAVFLISGTSGEALFADTAITPGTRPAGYTTSWRRIGVFRTNGSAQVHGFIQTGRKFRWSNPANITLLYNAALSGASEATVPLLAGKKWPSLFRMQISTAGGVNRVVSIFDQDGAAQTTGSAATPLSEITMGLSPTFSGGQIDCVTNTTPKVGLVSDGACTCYLAHIGWEDDAL